MELGNGEKKNTTGEPLLVVQSAIHHRTLSIVGAFSLRCAVELGIPDRIHAYGCQPMPLAALALSISVPPEKHPMLRRLMRLLSAQGVFAVQALGDGDGDGDGGVCVDGYLLTPFSRLLVDDGSPNMSAFVRALLAPDLVKLWHCMSEWLTQASGASNKSAFETAYGGKSFWEVARERPEIGRLFDEAMAGESRRTAAAVAACFPHVFRGIGTLVDVGGGNGTTARLVAEAFPQVKCTVLDLPHVVAAAPKCELFDAVGGDMFQHIPPADAVFLKNILHDWNDEECVKILKQCKKAISASGDGGKVIIVDIVINVLGDDPKKTETGLFFDVAMMIGLGGRERDESEWKQIFTEAGFANYKITPMEGTFSIIELFP